MARRRRCACTLPFSLQLTVMILGIVGIILSINVTVVTFAHESWYKTHGGAGAAKGGAFWFLITTVLIFVSGLQGLLLREGRSKWEISFFVVAVIVLIDLAVWILALIWYGNDLLNWLFYVIPVFVLELWVIRSRTSCKKETATVGMELPVANPGGAYLTMIMN